MIQAWLVVREEKHIDDKYWVFLRKEDALKVAESVTKFWCDKYSSGEIDTTLYEDLIFHHNQEDAFRVFVQPQMIRDAGETEQ